MEEDFHTFLYTLGDVQKGLEQYHRGRRKEGSRAVDSALTRLQSLLKGPEWPDFFSQVADYLAHLEMADLGRMENLASVEAGLLKKYGLTARDLLRLHKFYKGLKTLDSTADLTALFTAPETLHSRLAENIAAIKAEIDRARSLPRKLKKAAKKIAGSRLTHLLIGSALIGMNLFWQKDQQTSVSIGVIFLNSAVKK